jgi:hypothetical protein
MIEHSDEAWADTLRVERDNAAAEGRPYAVPMECAIEWSTGAPLPTILQWEHEAHVFFFLRDGHYLVGSIVFGECMASTFGPPGEEGHALQGSGWAPYTPLRVVNSAWTRRMFGDPAGLCHFVLPFHDRTFECLAYSFEASRRAGTMEMEVQAVMRRWE